MTFNKKYGNSPGQAIANGGGAFDTLAVFGAFFTVGKYNRDYDNILNGKSILISKQCDQKKLKDLF